MPPRRTGTASRLILRLTHVFLRWHCLAASAMFYIRSRMSIADLLEYAATRPGMVVSTRVRRVSDTVEAVCVSGWPDGPKPLMKVTCPSVTKFAEAVDRAAKQALDYWLSTARTNSLPAWLPTGDAAIRANLILIPVQTMRDAFA